MSTALVWLKRDLRIDDHAPLAAAAGCDAAWAARGLLLRVGPVTQVFDELRRRFAGELFAETP